VGTKTKTIQSLHEIKRPNKDLTKDWNDSFGLFYMFLVVGPPGLAVMEFCCETGSSHSAVSNLDFELRKIREFQNTSVV